MSIHVHVQFAFERVLRKAPGTSTSLYSSEHDPAGDQFFFDIESQSRTYLSPQRDHQDLTILRNSLQLFRIVKSQEDPLRTEIWLECRKEATTKYSLSSQCLCQSLPVVYGSRRPLAGTDRMACLCIPAVELEFVGQLLAHLC
jgi:hypothetical protein